MHDFRISVLEIYSIRKFNDQNDIFRTELQRLLANKKINIKISSKTFNVQSNFY